MKVGLSKRIIVQEDIDPATIKNAMMQFETERVRFGTLFRYYIGDQPFSESHSDGNKIVANFCRYICKTLQGYAFGNRPQYTTADDDVYAKEIVELFEKQEMWLTDSRLWLDMGIYGKAFELVYLPRDSDEPRSMLVHPSDAFVAYTGDLERDSIFGAVYFHYKDQNVTPVHTLYMYSRTEYMVWEAPSMSGPWALKEGPIPHGFGRVPLIEYRNNEEMMGDFEGIMDLQDAYNSLLSDRQDDKDAFASAMLLLTGQIIGTTAEEIEDGKTNLKQRKVLQLDEDATAEWLTKTMDETSVQVMQDQYASDIHKFAMVPDLSDEQFSGNASGVAMAYKLFGTDQVVAEKIEQFRLGFKRRCKLYDYRLHNPAMNPAYKPLADITRMNIALTMNTPQDLSYISGALSTLVASQIISKDTARRNLYLVEDPAHEAERIAEEQEELAGMRSSAFEDPYGSPTLEVEDGEDNAEDSED